MKQQKQYREAHKQELNEKQKEYAKLDKDKRELWFKTPFQCECGTCIQQGNKYAAHENKESSQNTKNRNNLFKEYNII
jgi:hypothetical protein